MLHPIFIKHVEDDSRDSQLIHNPATLQLNWNRLVHSGAVMSQIDRYVKLMTLLFFVFVIIRIEHLSDKHKTLRFSLTIMVHCSAFLRFNINVIILIPQLNRYSFKLFLEGGIASIRLAFRNERNDFNYNNCFVAIKVTWNDCFLLLIRDEKKRTVLMVFRVIKIRMFLKQVNVATKT